MALRQTFAKEGKTLRRKAGGYAHARQFKRLTRTTQRQRTILGKLIREVRGKSAAGFINPSVSPFTLSSLSTLLERADRIRTQKKNDKNDKNKLYALHAPEVECIRERQSPQPLRVWRQGEPGGDAQAGLDRGGQTFPR